jgi:hypothetical protein
VSADAARIDELEAEARYARERFRLYQARAYGSRPTSPSRLRELERVADGAEERVRAARAAAARAGAAAGDPDAEPPRG